MSDCLALFGGIFSKFNYQKKLIRLAMLNNTVTKLSNVKTSRNGLQSCQQFQYFHAISLEKMNLQQNYQIMISIIPLFDRGKDLVEV